MSLVPKADKKQDWARRGAELRLREIDQERSEIFAEFPELRGATKTRTMSPEARKRMSAGMRKYWLKRKSKLKVPGKNKSIPTT